MRYKDNKEYILKRIKSENFTYKNWIWAGDEYRGIKEYSDAISCYSKAIAETMPDPDRKHILMKISSCYKEIGNLNEAKKFSEKSKEIPEPKY